MNTETIQGNIPSQTLALIEALKATKSYDYITVLGYLDGDIDINATIPKQHWKMLNDGDLIGDRTLLMVLAKFDPAVDDDENKGLLELHNSVATHRDILAIVKFKKANPNARDVAGNTAAMLAAKHRSNLAIDFLARWQEVDWTLRNNDKKSAYDLAAEYFNHHVLWFLNGNVPSAVTKETAIPLLKREVEHMLEYEKNRQQGVIIALLRELGIGIEHYDNPAIWDNPKALAAANVIA